MKTIDRGFLFLVAGGLLLSGCDSAPPTDAVEVPEASFALELEDADEHGPVVASARGGGHYFTGEDEQRLRHTSVVALQFEDGTVRGQFEIRDPSKQRRVHGRVTCVEVAGNRAWIGGEVTSSSQPEGMPDLEGHETGFRVEDNGSGSEAAPDRVSEVIAGVPDGSGGIDPPPPGTADAVCEGMADRALPLQPIQAGNLTVEAVDDPS